MQSEDRYCATLAHKTNHSFQPNAQFVVFQHPKFGLIPAVMVTQDLEQGEEVGHDTRCPHIISHNVPLQIVVSYGYDLQESPLWYKQGWERCEVRRHGVSIQCLDI